MGDELRAGTRGAGAAPTRCRSVRLSTRRCNGFGFVARSASSEIRNTDYPAHRKRKPRGGPRRSKCRSVRLSLQGWSQYNAVGKIDSIHDQTRENLIRAEEKSGTDQSLRAALKGNYQWIADYGGAPPRPQACSFRRGGGTCVVLDKTQRTFWVRSRPRLFSS